MGGLGGEWVALTRPGPAGGPAGGLAFDEAERTEGQRAERVQTSAAAAPAPAPAMGARVQRRRDIEEGANTPVATAAGSLTPDPAAAPISPATGTG